MAYYELSKLIKMRRTALGYGRDVFENFGTTEMTVYRIESGRSKGTEQTYRKLTKALGREESIRQGILKTNHMDVLRMVNHISRALNQEDYAKAGELLGMVENSVETDTPRNRQYLEWIKAKLNYEQGLICTEEYKNAIKTALTYTIPKFGEFSLREWPFHQIELEMLFELSNLLRVQKRYTEQQGLLEDMKAALDTDYIGMERKILYRIFVLTSLADVLGTMGEHTAAIEMDRENLCLCESYKEFRTLDFIYYDIHWNYHELGKQKALSVEEEAECRQCLLKAYYLSKAQGIHDEFYERRLREQYPEELQ